MFRHALPLAVALCMFLHSSPAAHERIDEQIATISCRLIMESDPVKEAMLLVRRGNLWRIHREWRAAARDFRRARELDPTLQVVDLHLGVLWFDAARFTRARSHLDTFLASHPASVKGLVTRARVLTALGEHLAAAADYASAIARFSELGAPGKRRKPLPEYYLGRARSLVAAGSEYVGEAISTLDEGLERLGPVVTLELAALELESANSRYDAALARVERIASRGVRKERWLARRGQVLEKAGRISDAEEAYREALRAIEELPPARRGHRDPVRLAERVRASLGRLELHDESAAREKRTRSPQDDKGRESHASSNER